MSIVAKGSNYEKPRAGMHNAVCINVVDVGEQETEYKGLKRVSHKCVILFELEERYTKGERAGKRFIVSRRFTVSLSPKALLRDFIEWWIGKKFPNDRNVEFDIEKLIGKCAEIEIVHKNDYANIGIIGKPKKQIEPESLGYVPDWVRDLQEKRLDKPGQQLDIVDEFYDDPNKAFADAATADRAGMSFEPLGDGDVPFGQDGGDIPY